ncbi:hypothetical protein [Nocardia asiatica]|uniref:hypothetical protein n=1 Tax=Nocardia asiatica TaxID=209252 RepID=UPI0002EC82AF|nr:hypothetical protein [Nocardia asiatica]
MTIVKPLTIGTLFDQDTGDYRRVLRRGRTIVADCGHLHPNRDQSSSSNSSARDCITLLVRAAGDPDLLAERQSAAARNTESFIRFARPLEADEIRADAERERTRFADVVAALRALINGCAVVGAKDQIILAAVDEITPPALVEQR